MSPDLKAFICKLESELSWRYAACEDFAATPSSILLAVLNAVHEAKAAAGEVTP